MNNNDEKEFEYPTPSLNYLENGDVKVFAIATICELIDVLVTKKRILSRELPAIKMVPIYHIDIDKHNEKRKKYHGRWSFNYSLDEKEWQFKEDFSGKVVTLEDRKFFNKLLKIILK